MSQPASLHRDEVTGLVLAGGSSRRFGSDKAEYEFRGRTLLQHAVAAVEPLVSGMLVSVQNSGKPKAPFPARTVADRRPGLGPLAGLEAGLMSAETQWLLVVACDMPFLTREALETLLSRCGSGPPAVVACDRRGRRQPLCACYHRSILPVVARRLESDDRSMQSLLDEVEPACVQLPDDVLVNVNRLADLEAISTHHSFPDGR